MEPPRSWSGFIGRSPCSPWSTRDRGRVGPTAVGVPGTPEFSGGAGPEETVFMPYATGGVDWWLPWGFALGLQLRLATAAGGAGLGVNFATAF